MKIDIFVIDFDSTFVKIESLKLLTEIALYKHPRKREILEKFESVGNLCMRSEIDFKANLKMKIEILKGILKEEHLIKASKMLEQKVSPDIVKILNLIRKLNKKVIVVSNAFKLPMKEVMNRYGIEIYFANKHIIDNKGYVVGYDETNLMANNNGKENIIKFLRNANLITPEENIIMVGDGMPDLKVYQNHFSDYFLNFAINENRKLKKYRISDDEHFIFARKSDDIINFLKTIE